MEPSHAAAGPEPCALPSLQRRRRRRQRRRRRRRRWRVQLKPSNGITCARGSRSILLEYIMQVKEAGNMTGSNRQATACCCEKTGFETRTHSRRRGGHGIVRRNLSAGQCVIVDRHLCILAQSARRHVTCVVVLSCPMLIFCAAAMYYPARARVLGALVQRPGPQAFVYSKDFPGGAPWLICELKAKALEPWSSTQLPRRLFPHNCKSQSCYQLRLEIARIARKAAK